MKYFITEQEREKIEIGSTCYFEFQKGNWNKDDMIFWKPDSICIHDDIMYTSGLEALIIQVNPDYTSYGETRITETQWLKIYDIAECMGGELFELVKEANVWVKETFIEYKMFTILGL